MVKDLPETGSLSMDDWCTTKRVTDSLQLNPPKQHSDQRKFNPVGNAKFLLDVVEMGTDDMEKIFKVSAIRLADELRARSLKTPKSTRRAWTDSRGHWS
jgi:hypothetical protein